MEIYSIRHGQSQANIQGIYASIDTPLAGLDQESSEFLEQSLLQGGLYVSPAKRAIQTMEGIFARPGEIEDRLLEVSRGVLEGLAFSQGQENYPKEIKNWMRDPLDFGPSQRESIKELIDRVKSLLDDWIQLDRDVAAVTHEGVIRAFLTLISGQKKNYFKFFVGNTSLSILRIEDGFSQILQIDYE